MTTLSLVKERPILFSGEMVRAILSGNKMQTRRIVKPQPPSNVESATHNNARDAWFWWDNGLTGDKFACPYGKVGDRLWVRETWRPTYSDGPAGRQPFIDFKAGPEIKGIDYGYVPREYVDGKWQSCEERIYNMLPGYPRWRPSIHMPRWACRLLLEVVSVRVERLQNISEADAIAEGCVASDSDGKFSVPGPVYRYEQLWDSINGKKHPWASNPWVWVIEFKAVNP